MTTNAIIYIGGFLFIWFGAGLIVSSMDKFSRKLRLPSFAVSFIILGLLTSTPEFAVGLTAVAQNNAEVFVGNLLGGIPVIFLLIIPVLAILGNGIVLQHSFDKKRLLMTLWVILAPSIVVLDKRVSNLEGFFLIFLYVVLLFFIQKGFGFFDKENREVLHLKKYSYKDIIKVLVGIGIVFVTSQIVVEKTLYFSEAFHMNAFYISLIVLSLGTNLPELSLAIRSIASGKKDIAFGDYMGSASANTFLFGIFTIMHNGEVLTANNFFITFFFIAGGLTLFYLFSRSNNTISRWEGAVLLLLYIVFVSVELQE